MQLSEYVRGQFTGWFLKEQLRITNYELRITNYEKFCIDLTVSYFQDHYSTFQLSNFSRQFV